MSMEFKKPATCEGWASTLEDIIAAARAAIQARDRKSLSDANKALNKFIDAFDDSDFWSNDLDHSAREALGQLAVDITTATNDDLATRTNALRTIANDVNSTAAANLQAAADIRHAKLTNALVSAMDAAKAVKELQTAIKENSGDQAISDAAEALLETISNFKDAVTKSDAGG